MKEMKPKNFKVSMTYLQDKVKSLKAYSTGQEKEALLAPDEFSNIEMLELLSSVKPINEVEAMYLLLKLREISVSDVLEGMIDCPSCETLNQFQIELNIDLDVDESIPVGIFESIDDIAEADEMPLLEVNVIEEKLKKNNEAILNLSRTIPCRVCATQIKVDINPRAILSNTTLSNIFQEYFLFGKFLHYSNRDVDYLKPYERSILFKLLKKDVETSPQVPGL